MESEPRKIIEAFVYWVVPPACREEVLGDMRERNQNAAQYLIEAACTVPFVIYSRIRRTTDALVALMEALSTYTTFVVVAWWLDHALLLNDDGFARLAVPPVILLITIMLADAYSHPAKRWLFKPLFGPILGIAFTCAVELNHRWALPTPVLTWGSAMSMLFLSALRLTFPPVTERPQAAKIPAFWQKLELAPPSLRLRGALLPCALVLLVIVYLLATR